MGKIKVNYVIGVVLGGVKRIKKDLLQFYCNPHEQDAQEVQIGIKRPRK